MTPLSKSASAASDLRGVNVYRVAIVGALSLKGKEIAEVLRDRNFPPLTSACSMTMNLSVNWRRLATR